MDVLKKGRDGEPENCEEMEREKERPSGGKKEKEGAGEKEGE